MLRLLSSSLAALLLLHAEEHQEEDNERADDDADDHAHVGAPFFFGRGRRRPRRGFQRGPRRDAGRHGRGPERSKPHTKRTNKSAKFPQTLWLDRTILKYSTCDVACVGAFVAAVGTPVGFLVAAVGSFVGAT